MSTVTVDVSPRIPRGDPQMTVTRRGVLVVCHPDDEQATQRWAAQLRRAARGRSVKGGFEEHIQRIARAALEREPPKA